MSSTRRQIILKIACLVLTLVQFRAGNKFSFPTIGIQLFSLSPSTSVGFLMTLIYFVGLLCLAISIARTKSRSINYFTIGFILLTIEIAYYQFIIVPDCYWHGTSIYLWTAIPFLALGLIQIRIMLKTVSIENASS